MRRLTFGSLFAGIGGMDLGLERAGMECKWQVEIDEYCQRVLAKHWPNVRRWDDVRTFPPGDGTDWGVDLIAGGFPCQDISFAGKGAGLNGERSGLWYEFARVIRVLRPRFVLVENVAALLVRGLDAVLGTLASLGYDAEWEILPASAFGAPHRRNRLFIVAYPYGSGLEGIYQAAGQINLQSATQDLRRHWRADPHVGRVAYGIPNRVDRLRGLGNAVVPQVAEWIGQRIMEAASCDG